MLSTDGKTVAFERGVSSCVQTIDTVSVNGGQVRVLIPTKTNGKRPAVPSNPTYSSDGRYLAYLTTGCTWQTDNVVHVRNLRTGHEVTGPGYLSEHAVFVNNDSQIAYLDGAVVVITLPRFTRHSYGPPAGCQFVALGGAETELFATIACGAHNAVSLVALSTSTFKVTSTLARLGSCQSCGVAVRASDPGAILVASNNPCYATSPGFVYAIRGQTVHLVESKPLRDLPYEVAWLASLSRDVGNCSTR